MSETSASDLIAKLEAGLEGVTRGPWRSYTAPLRAGMTTINEVQCNERAPVVAWAGFDNSFRSKAKHKRNTEHIARCSPDNIRILLATIASLKEDNDRLVEERGELHRAIMGAVPDYSMLSHGQFLEMVHLAEAARLGAISRATDAEASNEALRVALEPFAKARDHFDGHVRDDDTVSIALRHIRAHHVRAAARALQDAGKEKAG